MGEEQKGITERIQAAIRDHLSRHHGPRSVTSAMLSITVYTDTTRPAATSVPVGTVIYNSTDGGLNVSDGTSWRGPNGGWANT